ncbi:MAG: AAA family ATPase [Bacteroidales bacterium]|nr:AAA family ATPase [Bacteroidales bacterium]
MKKQVNKKRVKFFGIDVVKNDNIDYQKLIARMFMCPYFTPEHAIQYTQMLENGELSVERLEEMIEDETLSATINNDRSDEVMQEQLKEWEHLLGSMTDGDKAYLYETYGFKASELKVEKKTAKKEIKQFNSPKELATIVQQYIKGQNDPILKLSVPIAMHDKCRRLGIPNIIRSVLLMGHTGTGKSEMIRRFGDIYNDIPIVHVNSNEIVATGWRGLHLTDMLLNVMLSKGYTIEQMKHAIIMVHEFDKIVHHNQRLVGEYSTDMDMDMVREYMYLFEPGRYLVLENGLNSNYAPCRYNLPTDNLLIIFDGAFAGIEDIIRKRLNINNRTLGFSHSNVSDAAVNTNLMKEVSREDLVSWGFIPEMVGRIDEVVVMNQLTQDVIYEILTDAKDNIMQTHIDFCQRNNINLKFTKEAIHMISNKAANSGMGFRDVRSSLSKIMTPIYFEHCGMTNSSEKQTIIIDENYVAQQLKTR